MRAKLFLIVGSAALLFGPTPGLTQFPQGGESRKGRPGGGEFRGPRGGERPSRGGGDANGFMNRLAQGRDGPMRLPMESRMQGGPPRSFERPGGGPGGFPAAGLPAAPGGFPGSNLMPGAPSGRSFNTSGGFDGRGTRGGGWNPDAMMDGLFSRQDQNGDGLLNHDEMPEALRTERDKWDTNRDGFIDASEFRSYFQARMQQALQERGGRGDFSGANGGWGGPEEFSAIAPLVEDRRPVVYHAGKLPRELPGWFAQLDADRDAQVGLYEWKGSSRSIEEFLGRDRNQDGFLTVEEVLRYEAQSRDKPGSTSDRVAMIDGRGPGAFGSGMPFRGPGGRGGEGGPSFRGPGGRGGEGGMMGRGPGGRGPSSGRDRLSSRASRSGMRLPSGGVAPGRLAHSATRQAEPRGHQPAAALGTKYPSSVSSFASLSLSPSFLVGQVCCGYTRSP